MTRGIRAAIVSGALAAAAAAPVPAWAQTGSGAGGGFGGTTATPAVPGTQSFGGDLTTGLVRPNSIRPPPLPEAWRLGPPPPPRPAQPALGGRPAPGGVMTEQQARDRVAAAGYTDVRPLRPTYAGSWTGYASRRGARVQVTIDPLGNISTKY